MQISRNSNPKLILVILLLSSLFLSSCNPRVITSLYKSYPSLNYNEEVVVYAIDQTEPENAELLGEVKIGDTGFSIKCNFDIVLDKAKLAARQAGGNAIKITRHKFPSLAGSSCHRITAKILKIEAAETITATTPQNDTDTAGYATLHIYRYSGAGPLIGYNLYLNDSLLCRVKNNFKETVKIESEGKQLLWAKTESKTELPIAIEKGKSYYLRCGITVGAVVGRPNLQLVDRKTGIIEFASIKAE